MSYQILRARKLSTFGNLHSSGQHTWRERPTPNADPARTPENLDLRPASSASGLVEAVRHRLELAHQRAKRPVICIEYLVTASPEAFARHSRGEGLPDNSRYFKDALEHLERLHGKQNIVAANLQLDERSPHLVVYAVPLVETPARIRKRSVIVGTGPDGKKQRAIREYEEAATVKLSAANFLDGRTKLAKLQTDFYLSVGKKYGLERGISGSRARHARVKRFYSQVREILPSIAEQDIPPPNLLEGKAAYGKRVAEVLENRLSKIIQPLIARSQAFDVARDRLKRADQRLEEAERQRRNAEHRALQARESEQSFRLAAEALSREKAELLAELPNKEAQEVLDAYRHYKDRRITDQATVPSRPPIPRPPPK